MSDVLSEHERRIIAAYPESMVRRIPAGVSGENGAAEHWRAIWKRQASAYHRGRRIAKAIGREKVGA